MLWIYSFCAVLLILIIAVPLHDLKCLWPAALLGLVKGLIVDSKFAGLNAYSFLYGNPVLLGLPTYYWLSGGVFVALVVHFLPKKKILRLPYSVAFSLALLVMEHIAIYYGYFFRYKWTDLDSLLLNLIVIASCISLLDWLGMTNNKKG